MTPPSGRQLSIASGGTRAVATEVGGGLRSLSVGGLEILDGYAADEQASSGRGQVLAPWPNRVRDGQWSWQGRQLQLPLTEVPKRNASHGLVRWQTWQVESHAADAVTLSCPVAPQPGWPFRLTVTASYTVSPGRLEVALSVRNDDSVPAPAGMGMHPYFATGGGLVDGLALELAAATELVADEQSIPTGRVASTGHSGAVGDAVIDTTYGLLARDADGIARAVITGPDRVVTVWMDSTWKWAQVFTGDTVDAARRRHGLAIEPLSCPPNALQTGEDLVVLEPGQTLTGRWGVVAEPSAAV